VSAVVLVVDDENYCAHGASFVRERTVGRLT